MNPAERVTDRPRQERHAETLDKRFHPDSRLKEILRGDRAAWQRFNQEPVDFDYWTMWTEQLNRLFREAPSVDQTRAIFVELHRRGFTNLALRTACEHILSRCRKWPFVADFLEGVKDPNEQN